MVRERLERRTAQSRNYRAMRGFTFEGTDYAKDDPFPVDKLSFHQIQTLHGARYIDLVPEQAAAEPKTSVTHGDVTLTDKRGGNYEITAPWLENPIKVRGRAAAEAEATRVLEEGPPKGDDIKVGDTVLIGDAGGELAGRYGSVNAIDGDTAEVYSFGITEETKGDLTKDVVPLAALSLATPAA